MTSNKLKYNRNETYRRQFLQSHNKDFRYFCAYCGRYLTREMLEVDHIIPCAKTRRSWFWRRYIDWKGYNGVNDFRNLTAACSRCNRLKCDKVQIHWLFFAFLSKKKHGIQILKVLYIMLLAFMGFSLWFTLSALQFLFV